MKQNKRWLAGCLAMTLLAGCGSENAVQDVTEETQSIVETQGVQETETADAAETAETVETTEQKEEEDAAFYVKKVENLPEGFIGGADVSSFLSLVRSGVVFYDYDGNALDEQGFFDLLAKSGIDTIRLRIWNDPYNSEEQGYGGGNNDLESAVIMGQLATNAGMNVLVDFHYSDFWADPAKQKAPKAWESYSVEEKEQKLYNFTKESLQTMLDAGIDISMVQIGNETTTGICGEKDWENMAKLFQAGSRAVREISSENADEIRVVLHFTNPEKADAYHFFAEQLENYQVDYDVFASSYYPYWHGSLANLKTVLTDISENFGKEVMVAETSWVSTFEEGDGHSNTIGATTKGVKIPYEASVQGQANALYAVIQTVADVPNGIGAFYWEPAWIPVADKTMWEKEGSGWASSYAGEYDEDAKDWYGGSAVDNQALFDFTGKPLETLRIFDLVETGVGEVPEDTEFYLENEAESLSSVTEIKGNLLVNPGFEQEDGWEIKGTGASRDKDSNNVLSGDYCLHYWLDTDFSFSVEQKLTLEPGTYTFGGNLEGGDKQASDTYQIYVAFNGSQITEDTTVTSWQEWSNPEITNIEITETTEVTVGFSVSAAAKAWGAWDDFYLIKQ